MKFKILKQMDFKKLKNKEKDLFILQLFIFLILNKN